MFKHEIGKTKKPNNEFYFENREINLFCHKYIEYELKMYVSIEHTMRLGMRTIRWWINRKQCIDFFLALFSECGFHSKSYQRYVRNERKKWKKIGKKEEKRMRC